MRAARGFRGCVAAGKSEDECNARVRRPSLRAEERVCVCVVLVLVLVLEQTAQDFAVLTR